MDKGILYYTDGELDEKIARPVREQLLKAGLPITSVSLKPNGFGDTQIHLPLQRGYLTMAKQILTGLEYMEEPVVFFCEHDCLYPEKGGGHFEFDPPSRDVYYYNIAVWKLNVKGGYALRVDDCRQLSGLCAYRDALITHFTERVKRLELGAKVRALGFEPGTHRRKERIDDLGSKTWSSEVPLIDIRHEGNATTSKWTPEEFRNKKFTKGWTTSLEIPSWGTVSDIVSLLK